MSGCIREDGELASDRSRTRNARRPPQRDAGRFVVLRELGAEALLGRYERVAIGRERLHGGNGTLEQLVDLPT